MKIITSVAGGGKTTKAIDLLIQHIKKGKSIHVMSGEMHIEDFGLIAYEKGLDLNSIEKIKFTTLSKNTDIFEVIDKDNSDVILLDGLEVCFLGENPFVEVDWDYVLKELKKTEEIKDVELYITKQANRDNNLARTPIVIEYAT